MILISLLFMCVYIGEDSRKNELDFHKKQEMKRWVTEKLYHEDYKKMNEKVEELNYVAMLHSIDAIRGKICPICILLLMFIYYCIIAEIYILLHYC